MIKVEKFFDEDASSINPQNKGQYLTFEDDLSFYFDESGNFKENAIVLLSLSPYLVFLEDLELVIDGVNKRLSYGTEYILDSPKTTTTGLICYGELLILKTENTKAIKDGVLKLKCNIAAQEIDARTLNKLFFNINSK